MQKSLLLRRFCFRINDIFAALQDISDFVGIIRVSSLVRLEFIHMEDGIGVGDVSLKPDGDQYFLGGKSGRSLPATISLILIYPIQLLLVVF